MEKILPHADWPQGKKESLSAMPEGLSGFAGIHGVKNFCIFAMSRFVFSHELLAETRAELACARNVMLWSGV